MGIRGNPVTGGECLLENPVKKYDAKNSNTQVGPNIS
jgi:hypothetical protein